MKNLKKIPPPRYNSSKNEVILWWRSLSKEEVVLVTRMVVDSPQHRMEGEDVETFLTRMRVKDVLIPIVSKIVAKQKLNTKEHETI